MPQHLFVVFQDLVHAVQAEAPCMAGTRSADALTTPLSAGVQKTAAQHTKQDKPGIPWFRPIVYWALSLLSLVNLLWNAEL